MKTVRLVGIDSDLPMLMYPYDEVLDPVKLEQLPQDMLLSDHLGGFDINHRNPLLDILQQRAQALQLVYNVELSFIPSESMVTHYCRLNLKPSLDTMYQVFYMPYENYQYHPDIKHTNFLCSFNGSEHISRQLLLANIHKLGWLDTNYVSKNFTFTVDTLDGHITNLVGDENSFYRKFFIDHYSDQFFASINNFGNSGAKWLESNNRFKHNRSIVELENKLTS